MKRLSHRQWLFQLRMAAARRRRERKPKSSLPSRSRFREVNQKQREGIQLAQTLPKIRLYPKSPLHAVLVAPRNLHFGLDHAGVSEFAESIRVLMGGNQHNYLDFTAVREAGPAAALHIAAEIDRWRTVKKSFGRPVVYDFSDWDPSIRRYFLDLGLFELLDVQNLPDDPPQISKQRVLKMRRNHMIATADVTSLRDELHTLCGALPNRLGFFDALCEAMANVVHHAYQEADPGGWQTLKDTWWMTADFDPGVSKLRVAFLDQGIGIPHRLPRSGWTENFEGWLASLGVRNDDAGRIEAALQYGRSSTGNPGRGKGFHDMRLFVDGHSENWMRVLSGHGECIYLNGKVQPVRHSKPIVGTIVEWSLVVPGPHETRHDH